MTRTSGGIRTALAATLAGLALAACGGTAADVDVEATPSPTEPVSEEESTAGDDDGTWHTLVVEAEDDAITLDKVELLSGAEAAAAMAEDGQPVEEGAEDALFEVTVTDGTVTSIREVYLA